MGSLIVGRVNGYHQNNSGIFFKTLSNQKAVIPCGYWSSISVITERAPSQIELRELIVIENYQ